VYETLHTELCQKYPQLHSYRIHAMLKPMFGRCGTESDAEEISKKFVKKADKKLAKFALDSNETELLNKLKVIFTEKDKTEFFLMRMVKKFGKLSFDQLCEKVNTYHQMKEKAASDPAKKKEFESLCVWLENAYPQFHKLRFIGLLKKFAHHDVETARSKIVKKLDKKLAKYEISEEQKGMIAEVKKSCPHWNVFPIMKEIKKNPTITAEGLVALRRQELARMGRGKR